MSTFTLSGQPVTKNDQINSFAVNSSGQGTQYDKSSVTPKSAQLDDGQHRNIGSNTESHAGMYKNNIIM